MSVVVCPIYNMGTATFLFVLALAASQAAAINILVPVGKELVYDYQSVVKAGILTGTSYSSLFVLKGKLILFGHEDMIECRLRDLKYTLHNGEVDLDTTIPMTEVTVPFEVKDLMKPFRIRYDHDGKVIGIFTDVDELEYSINIKRALATILQLDTRVKTRCTTDVCTFVTKEDGIYGIDKIDYNVMVTDDRDIVVQKMLERTSTRQLYQHLITNIFRPHHLLRVEHPLVRDCQKKYVIGTYHGHHVVKTITSEGGIYFTPFRTLRDTQYLLVTQTMRLIDITEITDRTFLKTPHFTRSLKYHVDHEYIKYGMIPDVRIVKDVKVVFPVIYTMLREIVVKLGDNPILEVRPDIYKTQLINRLHDILIRLDRTAMKELFMILHEKRDTEVIEVFYQVLPLVGTRASVLLIRDLILEKRVSERVMLHFLHVFPFHVRVCTENLLLEIEDLFMIKTDVPRTVYRAIVLGYTTLIRRIRENIRNSMMFSVMDETEVVTFMKRIDTICEKYLRYLFERLLTTTTDYDLCQIYISGIFNTKLEIAGRMLKKYLFDESIRHNVRINMLWTVGVTLKDTDEIFTVFWPILTNRHLHLEYRGIALYILLKTNPTTTRLLNLVWYMDTERNTELYNIYYTYLHTILRTTDVTKFDIKERVVKIIRLVRRPDIRSRSGFFALDYKDPIHNFGCTFDTFMMITDRSQYIKVITHGYLLGIPINYLTMIFRIDGLTTPLTDIIDINRLLVSRTSLFNTEEIMKLITVLKTGDIKMEVDVLVHEQVIFCKYFDKTNIFDLWRIVSDMSLFTIMKEYFVKINYNIHTTIMLPTDMGTMGMLEVKVPVIRKHFIDVTHDFTGGKLMVDMDMRLRESVRTTYGLTMYNPIVNVWQGVRKVKIMDVVLPIRTKFLFDLNTRVFKIVFKRTHDVTKDTVGLRTYVTGFVFLTKDIIYHKRTIDYDVKTRDLVVVRRDILRKENLIVDDHDVNTGLNYQVVTVDCDRPFTHGMLKRLWNIRRTVLHKNFRTNTGYWYLVMQNMYDYLVFHPCEGTCGIVFRGIPSKVYPVKETDLTFRFIPEVMITKDILLPGFKLDCRITYTVKTMDMTPLKTLDLTMYFDVNEGQTLSTLKMILTTMRRGYKDERVLIEGIKKWTDTTVMGNLKVLYGMSGVTEEPVMMINMHGGLLEDQTVGTEIKYGRCDLGVDYHPFKCLKAQTTLRKYDYDIKLTKRVPLVIKDILRRMLIDLKVKYDYDMIDVKDMVIPDDTIKLHVVYPLIGKVMDLKVLTTDERFMVSNIPVKDLKWLKRGTDIGFTPMFMLFNDYDIGDVLFRGVTWLTHGKENTRVSPMFTLLRRWGITYTCKVTPFTLRRMMKTKTSTMTDGWTMLIGDVTTKNGVFVKRLDVHDLMVLKIVLKDTKLEIIPVGDGMYKFIHNGVVVPFEKLRFKMGYGVMDHGYDRYLYDDVVSRDRSFVTDRFDDVFNIKKRDLYDDKFDYMKYKKYGWMDDKYDMYGKDVDYWMKYKDFLLKHKIPFTTKYFDLFKDYYRGDVDVLKHKMPFFDYLKKYDIYDDTVRGKFFDSKEYYGKIPLYKKDLLKRKYFDVDYKDRLFDSKERMFDTKGRFFDTKGRMFDSKEYLGKTYKKPWMKTDTKHKYFDIDSKEYMFDKTHKKPWKRDLTMYNIDSKERFNSKEYLDSVEHFSKKGLFHKMPWLNRKYVDSREKYFDRTGKFSDDRLFSGDRFDKTHKLYDMDSKEHFWNKDKLRTKLYDFDSKERNWGTKDTYRTKFFDVDSKERFWDKDKYLTKTFDTDTKDRLWGLKDKYRTKFFDVDSTEHMDKKWRMPWMKKHTVDDRLYDVDYKKYLMDSRERLFDSREKLFGLDSRETMYDHVKMPWMKKYYKDWNLDLSKERLFDSKEMYGGKGKWYGLVSREKYFNSKENYDKLHNVDRDFLYRDFMLKGKTPMRKYDKFYYRTGVDSKEDFSREYVDRVMLDDIKGRRYMDIDVKDKLYTKVDKYIRDSTCWGIHCMTRIVTGTFNFGHVTVDIVGRTVFVTTPKMTIFLEYNGRDVLIDYVKMKDYVGMCYDTLY